MSRLNFVSWLAVFLPLVGLSQEAVALDEGWIFQRGDSMHWANPLSDDAGWSPITVGKPWERQGFDDLDGFAWFRLRFTVPQRLRVPTQESVHRFLSLRLGRVDDVDETFFNGERIGGTGGFPPQFQTAWDQPRRYLVPFPLIRWDGENVIAVRVYDGRNGGGLIGPNPQLSLASWDDLISLQLEPEPPSGVFSAHQIPGVSVSMTNESDQPFEGILNWVVRRDSGERIDQVDQRVEVPPESSKSSRLGLTQRGPGFFEVSVSLQSDRLSAALSESVIIGSRIHEIQSALTRRDDFDAYWQDTLGALAEVDPEYELRPRPEMDRESHRVFEVQMRSLGGVHVGGWLEVPLGTGPFPALIRVPGYGQNMRPAGRKESIVVLSFNVRGHGNAQRDVLGVPQDFWIRGLDQAEGYYYQGAYADCVRAVDFLVSRSEVDASRIAITGASQGGGLSLATAALDSRIRLCAPDIPFLCDWVHYFQTSDWPEMNEWIGAEAHRTWDSTLATLSYFDTLNLASRIRCPVFLGLGLQDAVCPATTIMAVYNRLPRGKQLRVYRDAEHWVPSDHQRQKYRWLMAHFRRWGPSS